MITWRKNGYPFKYSCLENSMDRGAWWATVQVGHDWATNTFTFSYYSYLMWQGDNSVVIAVQSFSCVQLFVTPWTAAHQVFLSFTISWSSFKLIPIVLEMPSSHLILCCPLLLPPSFFPSIRFFSKESALHIRWPKFWSFNFSISPSNEYSGFISLGL